MVGGEEKSTFLFAERNVLASAEVASLEVCVPGSVFLCRSYLALLVSSHEKFSACRLIWIILVPAAVALQLPKVALESCFFLFIVSNYLYVQKWMILLQ